MIGAIKRLLYYFAKYSGGFWFTRFLYRKKIRFLCYHGFEISNETQFQPKLFISAETFQARLRHIQEKGYEVLSLSEAIDALQLKTMPDNAVVLTIDDGFFSVFSKAAPILKHFGFPASLYLTSYYFDRDCPIFSLAVKYMFWSSSKKLVNISGLELPDTTGTDNSPAGSTANDVLIQRIIDYGQSLSENSERVKLLKRVSLLLNIDYQQLNASRVMGLINKNELNQLLEQGIDIQLHTHRHNFPLDAATATDEIVRNRQKVDPLLARPMDHFCYPSGLWSHAQADLLAANQIRSATTCIPGLMDEHQSLYAIPRFLDGANISQIEFESELAGFAELCRKLKPGNRVAATQ